MIPCIGLHPLNCRWYVRYGHYCLRCSAKLASLATKPVVR